MDCSFFRSIKDRSEFFRVLGEFIEAGQREKIRVNEPDFSNPALNGSQRIVILAVKGEVTPALARILAKHDFERVRLT